MMMMLWDLNFYCCWWWTWFWNPVFLLPKLCPLSWLLMVNDEICFWNCLFFVVDDDKFLKLFCLILLMMNKNLKLVLLDVEIWLMMKLVTSFWNLFLFLWYWILMRILLLIFVCHVWKLVCSLWLLLVCETVMVFCWAVWASFVGGLAEFVVFGIVGFGTVNSFAGFVVCSLTGLCNLAWQFFARLMVCSFWFCFGYAFCLSKLGLLNVWGFTVC